MAGRAEAASLVPSAEEASTALSRRQPVIPTRVTTVFSYLTTLFTAEQSLLIDFRCQYPERSGVAGGSPPEMRPKKSALRVKRGREPVQLQVHAALEVRDLLPADPEVKLVDGARRSPGIRNQRRRTAKSA